MGYETHWLVDQEIIYLRYYSTISTEELIESFQTVWKLVDSSHRALVHCIVDVSDLSESLRPFDTVKAIRANKPHERFGWNLAILAKRSLPIELAIKMTSSIIKSRNRVFSSVEEAENFLQEMDPTIHWDKVNRSVFATS